MHLYPLFCCSVYLPSLLMLIVVVFVVDGVPTMKLLIIHFPQVASDELLPWEKRMESKGPTNVGARSLISTNYCSCNI